MKFIFKGIVQGVGFRPTIFRIAQTMDLKGYVLNKGSEVEVVIDKKEEELVKKAEELGADFVGSNDLIEKVSFYI